MVARIEKIFYLRKINEKNYVCLSYNLYFHFKYFIFLILELKYLIWGNFKGSWSALANVFGT